MRCMDCEQVQDQMVDYVEGTLSPRLRQAIDAHLGQCYACREERDALTAITLAARRHLCFPDMNVDYTPLHESVRTERLAAYAALREPSPWWQGARRTLAAIAAALVIGAFVHFWGQGLATLNQLESTMDTAAAYSVEDFSNVHVTSAFSWRISSPPAAKER